MVALLSWNKLRVVRLTGQNGRVPPLVGRALGIILGTWFPICQTRIFASPRFLACMSPSPLRALGLPRGLSVPRRRLS